MSEFNRARRDPLDEALASLPQDVAPQRELWPQIRAEIEKTPIARDAGEPRAVELVSARGGRAARTRHLVRYLLRHAPVDADARSRRSRRKPCRPRR